jgi:phosphoserine phosphatase RsbU/P
MNSRLHLPLRLSVREKILLVFLGVSVLSLLATGIVALYTITDVGTLAMTGSVSLGIGAVNASGSALLQSAEGNLVRIAYDQAGISDVIFADTESELDILAAHAAYLRLNPPDSVTAPWYRMGDAPPALRESSPVIFVTGTTVTPQSEEFRSLAGMAHLLSAVKEADTDIDKIYIATGSGVMWMNPGAAATPPGYDPRTRDWYTDAVRAGGSPVWKEPYVDAASGNLTVTCSKAVTGRYGTWVIATDITTDSINDNVLNLTLNGAGYPVLLSHTGAVFSRPGLTANGTRWDQVFTPDDIFSSSQPALAAVAANMTAGKSNIEQVVFNHAPYYVAYAPVPSVNGSFAVSKPVSEILEPAIANGAAIGRETENTRLGIAAQTAKASAIFALLFFLLLVVVVFLAWSFSRTITRPVDALKAGATALGAGNLEYRVDLRTGDEFEALAHSFNTMASDLRISIDNLRRTTAEKERYTKELEIAKEIQDNFLPETTPVIPGIGIAAATIPAMEIGGDFYDFIPAGEGRWGIAMADVSGKGISAALFMALSRTLLHVSGGTSRDPSAAVRQANRWIYEDGRSSMFVTLFYGVLDPAGMQFAYVNAGHNPPLLVREGGVQELGGSRGIALGVVPDVAIPPTILDLRPGDLLVLYTDGVTEAFNDRDEAFGEDRLSDFVFANRALPARALLDSLVGEIHRFAGVAAQSDDITLVIVKVA